MSVALAPLRPPARPGEHFHRLRVKDVLRETADAVSLVFDVPADLSHIFRYEAGQFVTLDPPVSSLPVRRCYSMSSSPFVDADMRITVKRVPGGRVSNWLNDAVSAGVSLAVSPPAGRFVLSEGAGDVVLFAGGSGVTPVLSIIKTVLAGTARRARLLYANRDDESVILRGELAALEHTYGERLSVVHHLDRKGGLIVEDDVHGFVLGARDAEYYICGPVGFMGTVQRGLASFGAEPSRMHIERFTVDESNVGGPTPVVPEYVEVSIELGGRRKTVEYRSGSTLLQTARAAGLGAPSSCELGTCGTCIARSLREPPPCASTGCSAKKKLPRAWY